MYEQKSKEMNAVTALTMKTSGIMPTPDTTALSWHSITYHMLKDPDTKKELLKDIDDWFRNDRLSDSISKKHMGCHTSRHAFTRLTSCILIFV